MLASYVRLRAHVTRPRLAGPAAGPHVAAPGRSWPPAAVAATALTHTNASPPHGVRLVEALEARGFRQGLRYEAGGRKIDHTLLTPYDLRQSSRPKASKPTLQEKEDTSAGARSGLDTGPGSVKTAFSAQDQTASTSTSFQLILANFVDARFDQDLQRELERRPVQVAAGSARHFDDLSVRYLRGKGYDTRDVILWLWIVSARDAHTAATRLMIVANRQLEAAQIGVPPLFVLNFLLRRPHINAAALKLLWTHATDIFQHRIRPKWRSSAESDLFKLSVDEEPPSPPAELWPVVGTRTFALMMIRFMRHARVVWPELLPSLAAAVEHHFLAGDRTEKHMDKTKLNFMFNKMLALFAIPSARFHHNFLYHQRAMHRIVSAMTKFDPPLLISREGYRAIVRLQLGHSKTEQETHWAQSKALSWPPWRTAKLGIDEDVGIEHGTSRAGAALSHLQSSGYEMRTWEDSAKVLAGWDTDNSPTIQTRTTIDAPPTLAEASDNPETVWASRIRATRTAEEAWKIFLDCREAGISSLSEPCGEMLRKLALREIGQEQRQPPSSTGHLSEPDAEPPRMPGDDLELTAPSQDPRMRPYLRVAVPDLEDFLNQSFTEGFKPEGRLLAFLLNRKPSYDLGRRILERSSLPTETVQALTTPQQPPPEILGSIEPYILAAAVRWLLSLRSIWESDLVKLVRYASWENYHNQPNVRRNSRLVLHAFRLVCTSKTTHAPTWRELLDSLSLNLAYPTEVAHQRSIVDMWIVHCRAVEKLQEVDPAARYFFPSMCEVFAEALSAQMSLQHTSSVKLDLLRTDVLHAAFQRWTGSRFRTGNALEQLKQPRQPVQAAPQRAEQQPDLLPPLLTVPGAAQLHHFARALAVAGDSEGLAALAQWMHEHHESLQERTRRGSSQPCLLAMRLGMEGARANLRASDEDVAAVRQAVEATHGPGSWPSDAALDGYTAKAKSRRLRLDTLRQATPERWAGESGGGGASAEAASAVRKVVPSRAIDRRWS